MECVKNNRNQSHISTGIVCPWRFCAVETGRSCVPGESQERKEKHVALPHRAYGEEAGAGIGLELWPPPKKGHLGAIETLKMKRYAHGGLPEEPLFPLNSIGTICAVRHSLSARQESFILTIGFLDLLPLWLTENWTHELKHMHTPQAFPPGLVMPKRNKQELSSA